MNLFWGLPFVAVLLSIALGPLIAPNFWHKNYGKISGFWSLLFLLPFCFYHGLANTLTEVSHVILLEYFPFIALLMGLFTTAGGICVQGNLHGKPILNTAILFLGTLLAGVIGTTGASMLLIRPLIRANDNRRHVTHIFVFFIFLVANVGGALSPLGDPPLFLGFLQGVDFFWPLKNLWLQTVFTSGILLLFFFLIDMYYFHQREEELPAYLDPSPDSSIKIEGKYNFLILAAMIVLVLLSGFWRPDINFTIFDTAIEVQNLTRDVGIIALAMLSLKITQTNIRVANEFSWEPMLEVAKLFAGIFLTIIPVITMLKLGSDGPFSSLFSIMYDTTDIASVANNSQVNALTQIPDKVASTKAFFWITGLLSAFLDNAPTYLVFFNLAGGNAQHLMLEQSGTLIAISSGAVFMGALTYTGNAPNLMIRAIATHRGIKMPGFFAYMIWSGLILIPIFAILSYFL